MSRHPCRSVRPGEALVVARLDDLAPSLGDLSRLLRGLEARGVTVCLGDAPIPADEAQLLMKGILLAAEFHARSTAARLQATVTAVHQSGCFRPGRPRTLDAERIAELRAAGLGATAIARELGVARGSVYRKLKEIEAPETRRIRRR